MLGLLTLIMFSVTGIMLNHEEWFGFATPHIHRTEGTVPAALLVQPDKLAIVEKLRKDFGAPSALESFDEQNDRLELVFKSPDRRTEAAIDRPDGHAAVSVETHGFAGRCVGLHRGTDADPTWRLVIDISAVLLLVSAATGLTLWLLVPKWRPPRPRRPGGLCARGCRRLLCAGPVAPRAGFTPLSAQQLRLLDHGLHTFLLQVLRVRKPPTGRNMPA